MKVDLDVAEWAKNYSWFLDNAGYAHGWVGAGQPKSRFHRLVVPGAPIVDHINHDILDNRRCNLRAANGTMNRRNTRGYASNPYRYKGVYPTPAGKWNVSVYDGTKLIRVGTFACPHDAATAYNLASHLYVADCVLFNTPLAPDLVESIDIWEGRMEVCL